VYGFVIIQTLTQPECDANIKRQVTDVMLKQPWRKTLVVHDPLTKAPLDIEADTARYLQVLKDPVDSKATLASYEEAWTLHAGFGACCDPSVFHLEDVWRVRQDPALYNAAVALLGGNRHLWVDINRSIQKLPFQGESECLHWDLDYLHRAHHGPIAGLSGKVMFTDGSFVCVPGSATAAFHADFRAQYAPLYPNAKAKAAKFALDKKKPDPMGLFAAEATIPVPAGCAVFWSEWLLHGFKPNRSGRIQWGMYLGYMPAAERPAYKKKTGVDERVDRIRSYRLGVAPKLWPSLDRIYYYPKRYQNYLHMLQKYIDRVVRDHPFLATRVIQSGAYRGTTIVDLVPQADPAYVAFELTPLGQALLGLIDHPPY
jgi:hypothetical protein